MNKNDDLETEHKNQIQIKTYTSKFIMPFILGLVIDNVISFLEISANIDLLGHAFVAIILGVTYSVFYIGIKRPKKFIITRKAAKILTISFIVSIILICIAALILYIDLPTVIIYIGWLSIIILFIQYPKSLSSVKVVPKYVFMGIITVSLGSAVSIGAIPIVGFAVSEPTQLTIYNYSDTAIEYEPGNWIYTDDSKTIDVPPLTVLIEYIEDQVIISAFYTEQIVFDPPENVEITFNEQLIKPGNMYRINLMEQKHNKLIITCG